MSYSKTNHDQKIKALGDTALGLGALSTLGSRKMCLVCSQNFLEHLNAGKRGSAEGRL